MGGATSGRHPRQDNNCITLCISLHLFASLCISLLFAYLLGHQLWKGWNGGPCPRRQPHHPHVLKYEATKCIKMSQVATCFCLPCVCITCLPYWLGIIKSRSLILRCLGDAWSSFLWNSLAAQCPHGLLDDVCGSDGNHLWAFCSWNEVCMYHPYGSMQSSTRCGLRRFWGQPYSAQLAGSSALTWQKPKSAHLHAKLSVLLVAVFFLSNRKSLQKMQWH